MLAGKTISLKHMAIVLVKLLGKYSPFYSSLITCEFAPMVLDQEDTLKVIAPKTKSTILTVHYIKKNVEGKGGKTDKSNHKLDEKKTSSKDRFVTMVAR